MDYKNGEIYAIRSPNTDKIYIPDTLPDQASWALYDMTELLGGKRRKETFSTAEQYKNSEFREVVNFFTPIVRTVSSWRSTVHDKLLVARSRGVV